MKVPRNVIEEYVRTSYRVVGKHKHSSIKPCYWLEQKLLTGRENRNCYKGYWGVNSEQCIQNSPSFPFCKHNCVFCWRDTSCSLGSEFSVTPDEPEYLIEQLIRHQKNLIQHNYPLERIIQNYHVCCEIVEFFRIRIQSFSIFKKIPYSMLELSKNLSQSSKGDVQKAILLLKNCEVLKTDDLEKYYLSEDAFVLLNESKDSHLLMDRMVTNPTDMKTSYAKALHPNHAAISLDGEPTLYPFIGEFITTFRSRNFTTFIVTSGTDPNVLTKLMKTDALPSILYVTLPPPTLQDYLQIHRPKEKDTWEKIHHSLGLLKDINSKTRTVLRITAVNHLNIREELIDGYIEMINHTQPNFVDVKGFTLEGASMSISSRLDSNHPGSYYFPEYFELQEFSLKLCEKGGFRMVATHEGSRDILIAVNWNTDIPLKLQENEK